MNLCAWYELLICMVLIVANYLIDHLFNLRLQTI